MYLLVCVVCYLNLPEILATASDQPKLSPKAPVSCVRGDVMVWRVVGYAREGVEESVKKRSTCALTVIAF